MSSQLRSALPAIGVLGIVVVGAMALKSQAPATATAPAQVEEAPAVVQQEKQRTLMLHTSDWKFMPNTIRLKKGENVALHLMGMQGYHGLAIPGLGIDEEMAPGSAMKVTIPTDKAGTFPFYCNISCGSGHDDMKGTIIIE